MEKMKEVIVFFGLTASGKSYLAKAWAAKHGYPYFNTDVIRKELAGIDTSRTCQYGIEAGIYTSEFSRKTYDTLLENGLKAFGDTAVQRVVLDGSYQRRNERRKVYDSFSPSFRIFYILCSCSEMVVRERLAKRLRDATAVSDGRWEIYQQQQKTFEKPYELLPEQLLELDTSASLEYLIARLEKFLSMPGL